MTTRSVLAVSTLAALVVFGACKITTDSEELGAHAGKLNGMTPFAALSPGSIDHPVVNTVTQRYDNARSGVNANEAALTPATIATSFGKLSESSVVDARVQDLNSATGDCAPGTICGGGIFAQPLVVDNVSTYWSANGSTFGPAASDVLYVATSQNWVLILDASDLSVRMKTHLGTPYLPYNPDTMAHTGADTYDGIMSTPVIDRTQGKIYVVTHGASGEFILHALRTDNLEELAHVTIAPTGPNQEPFAPETTHSRPGLLLTSGQVFVAFGGNLNGSENHDQFGQYRGWVVGFDADTLAQTSVLCTAPDPVTPVALEGSGIWQSGTGLAADEKGIYFQTGNGRADSTHLGDSVVRMPFAGSTLSTVSSFNPIRGATGQILEQYDLDLGSSAPLLIGDDLIVGGGKEGVLYLLDRTTTPPSLLQSFRATYNQFDREYCESAVPSCTGNRSGPGVTSLPPSAFGIPDAVSSCCDPAHSTHWYAEVTTKYPHIHNQPLYWATSGLVYVWAERDVLRGLPLDAAARRFAGQESVATGGGSAGECGGSTTSELFCPSVIFANPPTPAGEEGGMMTLSSNGNDASTGVLWAAAYDVTMGTDPERNLNPVLHAYKAVPDGTGNLTQLWSSASNARDPQNPMTDANHLNGKGKWALPTVRNGRVYVAEGNLANSRIASYGLQPIKDGWTIQCTSDSAQADHCKRWLTGFGEPDWAGVGDFNGDGKDDIAWYNLAKNGSITVALSDGSGSFDVDWTVDNGQWLTGFGTPDWVGVGDFDDDGKADIAWYNSAKNGSVTVARSTGSAFAVDWGVNSGQWLTGFGMPDWAGVGDFDKDGRADIAWYEAGKNGSITVAASTGNAFAVNRGVNGGQWLTGFGKPDWAGVGDFNHDGRADIAWYNTAKNGSITVATSNGTAFDVDWGINDGQWTTGLGKPDWAAVGDFNGDGWADIGWYEAWKTGSITVAFNGQNDRFSHDLPSATNWGRPDWGFVGNFDGPKGGTTDVAWYEPSKNWGVKVGLSRLVASAPPEIGTAKINANGVVNGVNWLATDIHAGSAPLHGTTLSIFGAFAPAGNVVHLLGSDNKQYVAGTVTYQSSSQINFQLDAECPIGSASLWLDDAHGFASNVQKITVLPRPSINANGIVNGVDYRADHIHTSTTISIFGQSFSPKGNVVTVVDRSGRSYAITAGSSGWYESPVQINATLPNIAPGAATVLVTDAGGPASTPVSITVLP